MVIEAASGRVVASLGIGLSFGLVVMVAVFSVRQNGELVGVAVDGSNRPMARYR